MQTHQTEEQIIASAMQLSVERQRVPKPTDENCITPEMVEVYRGKTPTERLQIAFGMWRSARKIAIAAVRQQHPDWTLHQQQAEVARRMSETT